MRYRQTPRHPSRQKGNAAIEFALLFSIFFAIAYAAALYGITFLLQQGLTEAAAEGARASLRLDQTSFSQNADYEAAVVAITKDAATNALSWLPEQARNAILSGSNVTTTFVNGTKTVTSGNASIAISTKTVTVTVTYPNYATSPPIPNITFGDALGTLPLPTNLVGQASLQLQL